MESDLAVGSCGGKTKGGEGYEGGADAAGWVEKPLTIVEEHAGVGCLAEIATAGAVPP